MSAVAYTVASSGEAQLDRSLSSVGAPATERSPPPYTSTVVFAHSSTFAFSETPSPTPARSKAAWKARTTFDLVKPGGAGGGGSVSIAPARAPTNQPTNQLRRALALVFGQTSR